MRLRQTSDIAMLAKLIGRDSSLWNLQRPVPPDITPHGACSGKIWSSASGETIAQSSCPKARAANKARSANRTERNMGVLRWMQEATEDRRPAGDGDPWREEEL